MEKMEFSERAQNILKAVVLSYIRTAFPVGSRMITKSFDLGVSAATVRNIMADLEEQGYLYQPHTSSGRIPSDLGYRFYVDHLLENEFTQIGREGIEHEKILIEKKDNFKNLLQETSRLLSEESQLTGVVLAPRLLETKLTHFKFVRLDDRYVLAILVTQGGVIQNKIFEMDEAYEQEGLDRISQYLNGRLKGSTLQIVRQEMFKEMRLEKQLYDELFEKVLDEEKGVFSHPDEGEVFVGGTSHILDIPEYSNMDRMRTLFKTFEEKYLIVKLLDRCMGASGVQVFIGSENMNLVFQGVSLVVSTYRRGDQTLGSLGVIGPTRMDYSKVIPLVENTANLLTRVLQEG